MRLMRLIPYLVAVGLAALAVLLLHGLWPRAPFALRAASFDDLPGWAADDHHGAFQALLISCGKITSLPDDHNMGGAGFAGMVTDWRPVCAAAATTSPNNSKTFFEMNFRPWAVYANGRRAGLFTGYFAPVYEGALQPGADVTVPLLAPPPDMISVDLGLFRDDLKGQRIAGQIDGNKLVPLADRAAIEAGALSGKGLELAWLKDPVDAFFLHIQGSGTLVLPDGTEQGVGYAGQNGHPYTAIGRILIDEGEVAREDMSMQAIRRWLADNPDRAAALMNANKSYVFFRPVPARTAIGAQDVPLTDGRSLAVDRKYMPLGAPIWLDTTFPGDGSGTVETLQRLLIAQDTGGAIRGAVRGDVYFGRGAAAGELAGRMKQTGRYWILLPQHLDPTQVPDDQ